MQVLREIRRLGTEVDALEDRVTSYVHSNLDINKTSKRINP